MHTKEEQLVNEKLGSVSHQLAIEKRTRTRRSKLIEGVQKGYRVSEQHKGK